MFVVHIDGGTSIEGDPLAILKEARFDLGLYRAIFRHGEDAVIEHRFEHQFLTLPRKQLGYLCLGRVIHKIFQNETDTQLLHRLVRIVGQTNAAYTVLFIQFV